MFLGSQATEDQNRNLSKRVKFRWNRKLKECVKFRRQVARHPHSYSGDPKSFRACGLLSRDACYGFAPSGNSATHWDPWELAESFGVGFALSGKRDLKCSAKDDVCRMLNPCDAITVGDHSALSFIATSGCGSARPIASARINIASTT